MASWKLARLALLMGTIAKAAFVPGPEFSAARYWAASVLPTTRCDVQVMLFGGFSGFRVFLNTTDVLGHMTGASFHPGPSMLTAREGPGAISLNKNGWETNRLLVVGGRGPKYKQDGAQHDRDPRP